MKEKVSIPVKYVRLDTIEKYPTNPRTITEASLQELCNSIQEDPLYFETRPIICSNRTGKPVIIAGEKRYLAALKLGFETAPVAIIPNLTEEDEQRILLKDNGSFGEWDYDMLQDLGWDLTNSSKWGVGLDFSKFTSDDEKSIVGEDYEATAHLQYLTFENYRIPLSDIEVSKLHVAIDAYMAANGTLIGFVNSIFPGDE
jgi:hypothetical protein